MNAKKKWDSGIHREMRFWWSWIAKNIDDIPKDQSSAPLKDFVRKELGEAAGDRLDILEIGPGLLPALGNTWGDREIRYQTVDALADFYTELHERHGIIPMSKPIKAHGESLLDVFSESTFDFVYSCNALDHAYAPGTIISNMFKATKPGGTIYIAAAINEGLTEAYHGLHQWNFDVFHGHVVLWNRNSISYIESHLGEKGSFVYRFDTPMVKGKPEIHIIIKKA